jgi:hypothetical protein
MEKGSVFSVPAIQLPRISTNETVTVPSHRAPHIYHSALISNSLYCRMGEGHLCLTGNIR